MDSGDKKKKQRPYSEYERQLLIQLVQSKIDVVENRRTDGTTLKKKSEAWEDITTQYNNSCNVSQIANAAQLKKMWQNLKTKARDAKTLDAQRKWTGGGPALPDIGKEETQVLSVIPTLLPSINVEIDSDIGQPSTSQLCQDDDDSLYWQPKRSRNMDVEVHVVEEEGENTESLQGTSTKINNNLNKFLTPPSKDSKRRLAAPRESKSLEDLKKEFMKKEIDKINQQMKQEEEKHNQQMKQEEEKHNQQVKQEEENHNQQMKQEEEKHNQQVKQEEEKHRIELEILVIKRDILKKELNNK